MPVVVGCPPLSVCDLCSLSAKTLGLFKPTPLPPPSSTDVCVWLSLLTINQIFSVTLDGVRGELGAVAQEFWLNIVIVSDYNIFKEEKVDDCNGGCAFFTA